MNQNNGKGLYLNLSGIGLWATIFGVIWLLSSIGLGWIVKSLVVLIFLLLIAPVIAYLAFRWWFRRNVIESSCPVCSTSFVGINKSQTRCPNCGEMITVQGKTFVRYNPPGTVDVDVIDVSVKQLDVTSKSNELDP